MNDIFTSAQVKELFEHEAVLIGARDGVPLFRAVELFGEKAADYAYSAIEGGFNFFGIGYTDLPYLTFKGFQSAAGYANVEKICKARPDHGRAKHGAESDGSTE